MSSVISSEPRSWSPARSPWLDRVVASPAALARTAGVLYLVLAIGSSVSFAVSASVFDADDPSSTAEAIRSSTALIRTAFLSELVAVVAFGLTALVLHELLRHVQRLAAAAMAMCVAVSVAIQSANLVNQYTALRVVTSDAYQSAFGAAGSDALGRVFVDMQHDGGFLVAQTFFGLWLVPLGYLVIRSGWFPKVLGVVLVVASATYILKLFVDVVAADLGDRLSPVASAIEALAEVVFICWLLVKGVRTNLETVEPTGT